MANSTQNDKLGSEWKIHHNFFSEWQIQPWMITQPWITIKPRACLELFCKGIYTTPNYTDHGKRKKRKTKELENHEIPATMKIPLVGALPHDKKVIVFRKSDVGILKSIFDVTEVNTKIKSDTFDACFQRKAM